MELKFKDMIIENAGGDAHAISSTWTLIPVDTSAETSIVARITSGTGASNRIGRSIKLYSIQLRGAIQHTQGILSTDNDHVRFVMVADSQCNGAAPAVLDIWASDSIDSFLNLQNEDRFDILYDNTYVPLKPLAGDGTTLDSGLLLSYINITLPVDDMETIDYLDSNGTVSDLTRQNIFMMVCSRRAQPATIRAETKLRLRYSG